MTFRTKLLLIFTFALVAAIAVVELLVQGATRREFEKVDAQRANALAQQFQNEFHRRGKEIVRSVNALAASNEMTDLVIAPDPTTLVDAAPRLAASRGLDVLELIAADGTILSSAEFPARFNYHEDWIMQPTDWKARGAFLRTRSCRKVSGSRSSPWPSPPPATATSTSTGGQQLDRDFLSTLVLPAGMRVLLYRNLAPEFVPARADRRRTDPCATPRHCARIDRTGAVAVRRSARPPPASRTIRACPSPDDQKRCPRRPAHRQFAAAGDGARSVAAVDRHRGRGGRASCSVSVWPGGPPRASRGPCSGSPRAPDVSPPGDLEHDGRCSADATRSANWRARSIA